MTFNHGVEGSSPSALTKEINKLDENFGYDLMLYFLSTP